MGFRNPLTNSGSVDTGAYAGAGVRVYEDTSSGFPTGVVEFYSGVDPSAKLTATPLLTPQGAGAYTSVGSTTTLHGIDDHAITAPTLGLNIEAQGPGGYASVARITDASSVDFGGAHLVNAPELADGGWVPFVNPIAPFTKGPNGCWYRRRRGVFHMTLELNSAGALPTASNVYVLDVPDRPAHRQVWTGMFFGGNAVGLPFEFQVNTDGTCVLVGRGLTPAGGNVAGSFPLS